MGLRRLSKGGKSGLFYYREHLMAHIIETIMGIRRGRFAELCSSKLTDVVKAVAQLNKPGSITIQLKLKPNTEGQVRLSGTV